MKRKKKRKRSIVNCMKCFLRGVCMDGVRCEYQEDPRRRNNFSFGLHAEIWVREGIKDWRLPIQRPAVLFVPSTRIFLAKVVYMVPESSYILSYEDPSARKILALGTCIHFCMQIEYRKHGTRMIRPLLIFLVLGSFSLYLNNPLLDN